MGGAGDDEPPSKRVKVSSGKPGDLSEPTLMAGPRLCQGDDEVIGKKGVVKKTEFVQIIAEALCSLGYNKTGACLVEESGIPLQSSVVKLFTHQILDGKWDEGVATLRTIGQVDEKTVKAASFVILEQKFFELLNRENITGALKTLRTEIAPLCVKNDRVHELSSCILSGRVRGVKSRTKLLEELQKLLPPSVIISELRLVHLVEQALDLQVDSCRFHNSLVGEMSLLTDHQCGKDQIPSQTLQILRDHSDEVWFLQFSHDGKYLASSAVDCSVIIWEVKPDGLLHVKHQLLGHRRPVSYISWSPDDHELLTCGVEEVVRRWDVESGECIHIYEKTDLGLISCVWAPDGKRVLCGVTDKSISVWDLEGKELECWKGRLTKNKISDLGITSDGKHIISVCDDNEISIFGWESESKKKIREDKAVTSFALSTDSKYLLVSLANQEIHLWDIEGSVELVAKYKGHKRIRFVVRSCFGGLGQAFIASGSEDSQVYIWHRSSGDLIQTLAGHSGTVNCVSWNPANPHMLASASDDHTIRIWGLNRVNTKQNGTVSNGFHHCNGGT